MKKVPPSNPATWQDFGQFLFACREADPGYYVLHYLRENNYKMAQLKRFVVGWCTFYNLGIAAKASELQGQRFYDYLENIYPTAKRASERRHFRGAAGLKAIAQWRDKFPQPEMMCSHIFGDAYEELNMGFIRDRCSTVAQMGDYFKWKWGDLGEVLLQTPVQFRGWEQQSPKVPQQGAALIAEEAGKPDLTTTEVYRAMVKQMRKLRVQSPYAEDLRQFDVQDAETICCVYKQYRSGSYIPGLRTAKAATRLAADGDGCKTARDALRLLLDNQPRKEFSDPVRFTSILEGMQVYTVDRFLA